MIEPIKPTRTPQKCPCCNQSVQLYHRRVHLSMALALHEAVKRYDVGTPFHIKEIGLRQSGGDFAKLAYWDLIVPPVKKDGHWIVTRRGADFIRGKLAIAAYAIIYNGKVLGYSQETITAKDVKGFNIKDI